MNEETQTVSPETTPADATPAEAPTETAAVTPETVAA